MACLPALSDLRSPPIGLGLGCREEMSTSECGNKHWTREQLPVRPTLIASVCCEIVGRMLMLFEIAVYQRLSNRRRWFPTQSCFPGGLQPKKRKREAPSILLLFTFPRGYPRGAWGPNFATLVKSSCFIES